jgi:hypothetical protein
MEQYPDSITVTVVTAPTQNTSTLQWTEGSTVTYTFDCRAEVNGTGKRITGSDGSLIEFAYSVFMPLTDVIIPPDSVFTLTGSRFSTVTGRILRASNGQLNSRLWV